MRFLALGVAALIAGCAAQSRRHGQAATPRVASSADAGAARQSAAGPSASERTGAAGRRLAVGTAHACAVTRDGRVLCWGSNDHGQMGRGHVSEQEPPEFVPGVSEAVEVAVGSWHSCARTRGGEVQCWGFNDRSQLGDGTTTERTQPVPVFGLSAVVQLVATYNHACVRREDGDVLCWGESPRPSSVTEDAFDATRPHEVPLPFPAAGIAVGPELNCAFDRDGQVACWGTLLVPMGLGTGSRRVPEPRVLQTVPGTAGLLVGRDYVCALRDAGDVWCWGHRTHTHDEPAWSEQPAAVPGVADVAMLRGADFDRFALALRRDGSLLAWGQTSLGDPPGADLAPRVVPRVSEVVEVDGARDVACVRTRDERVLCLGNNRRGRLGLGVIDERWTTEPVPILAPGALPADAWRRRTADGLGDACDGDADCGWDDPCAPQRCEAHAHQSAATCSAQPPSPGSCRCVTGRCALRPAQARAPEGSCAHAACGLDQGAGRCVVGAGMRGNRRAAEGPVCYCDASARCAFEWLEPVPCHAAEDCWIQEGPLRRPIRRPAHLRGRRFRPCSDGETPPACIEGRCGFGPTYGC